MSDDPRQNDRLSLSALPPGGAVMFVSMAVALVVGAFVVPEEWILKLNELYRTPEAATDAFDDEVRELDTALDQRVPLEVTRAQFREYEHHVAARRLAAAGKMTGEEVRTAAKIYREFLPQVAAETTEGSRDAMRSLRNQRLDEALPRVTRDTIDDVTRRLRADIDAAAFLPETTPEPSASGAFGDDCASCHLSLRDLPGDSKIDLEHLWPQLDHAKLGAGSKLPIMMSAAESEPSACVDCHAPHGSDDFGVSLDQRADNIGLWTHANHFEGLIRVKVKTQNINSPHRIPGGGLSKAYAIAVTATHDGEPLPAWWGERLPEHLQSLAPLGLYLGRIGLDREGRFTTDPDRVVTLVEDQRLEAKRFYDEYFLFQAPESGEVDVTVQLLYLADAEKPEPVPVQVSRETVVVR